MWVLACTHPDDRNPAHPRCFIVDMRCPFGPAALAAILTTVPLEPTARGAVRPTACAADDPADGPDALLMSAMAALRSKKSMEARTYLAEARAAYEINGALVITRAQPCDLPLLRQRLFDSHGGLLRWTDRGTAAASGTGW